MYIAGAEIRHEQHIFNNNNCSEERKKKKKRRGVRATRRVYFWEGQAEPSRRQAELRAQMYPFPQIFHIHHLSPAQINHRAKQARVPSAARTHKLKAGTWRERERPWVGLHQRRHVSAAPSSPSCFCPIVELLQGAATVHKKKKKQLLEELEEPPGVDREGERTCDVPSEDAVPVQPQVQAGWTQGGLDVTLALGYLSQSDESGIIS